MLKKLDVSTTNCLKVADYLDTLDPDEFHMQYCSSCICGHINRAFLGGMVTFENWNEARDKAATFLDLDEDMADELFEPGPKIYNRHMSPTPQDAAKVLRYLALAGEVVWS